LDLEGSEPGRGECHSLGETKVQLWRETERGVFEGGLETDLSGRKFWVVEGIIHVRRWLFRRRRRRFTYYVDVENGKILIMRMKNC